MTKSNPPSDVELREAIQDTLKTNSHASFNIELATMDFINLFQTYHKKQSNTVNVRSFNSGYELAIADLRAKIITRRFNYYTPPKNNVQRILNKESEINNAAIVGVLALLDKIEKGE